MNEHHSANIAQTRDEVSSISVIIPSAMTHDQVTASLHSVMVAAESSPLPTEVIFVANGKNARNEKIDEIRAQFQHVTIVQTATSGKNRALNLGLRQAGGALIVFFDDDVIIGPNYFGELLEGVSAFHRAKIFAGPVRLRWPPGHENTLDKAVVAHAGSYVFAYIDIGGEPRIAEFSPIESNFAIRRSDLSAFLPLDENSGPAEGLYRMFSGEVLFRSVRESGYNFAWLPGIPVEHIVREEQLQLGWIRRRCFRWGRAADFFGYPFRSISGTASTPRLMGSLAIRTLRIIYFWAARKNVPLHWAIMDQAVVLGMLYERAARFSGGFDRVGSRRRV